MHPDSIDFEILGPVWLAVAMIVLLMGRMGWVGGTLVDAFGHSWPAPTRSVRGIAGLFPLASRWAPVALPCVGVVGWSWITVTAVQVLSR